PASAPATGNQRTGQVRSSEYGDETVTDTSLPSAKQPLDEEDAPTVELRDENDGDDADHGDDAGVDEAASEIENELFRQSEIAADYVEGLLDILDYDGD